MANEQKVALIILDGWGHGEDDKVSAIAKANTPFVDSLYKNYPNAELVTFGEEVGLPEGQMGNSEVGHLNIGAGRVVYQELARINKAIRERTLHELDTLLEAMKYARDNQKRVHLMGLLSDGGVHSHINHVKALCDIAAEQNVADVFVHVFTDGRDTAPQGGIGYVDDLEQHIEGKAKIASVIGRYYAMDRDKRWERVKLAYDLLVNGQGEQTEDIKSAIQSFYDNDITDEFMKPIIRTDASGTPLATIEEGDVVLCFNFRTDRCREITEVLSQSDFPDFDMKKMALRYVTMTRYDESFEGVEVLFHKEDLSNTLGEVLERAGKTQLRMAETEKYPHVTFFFSGGREDAFEGENRIITPSPKVATYDLQPEMSAHELTASAIKAINETSPDFICLNYANADMVGHTGVFDAAVKAAEIVDNCVQELINTGLEKDYQFIIIADHGNSDIMIKPDGSPHTAHTTNMVPCFFVGNDVGNYTVKSGKLGDIAPSILSLMDIEIPKEMNGEVIIK